jgi:hypothetical protein
VIDNRVIQRDLVAWLKLQAALSALLAGGTNNEVREDQYQGTVFGYPAVRVNIITQDPIPERERCDHTRLTGSVRCYAEGASSRPADNLAGVVNGLLHRLNFHGTGWYSWFRTTGLVGAILVSSDKLWRSEVMFAGVVYPTTNP